MDDGVTKHMRTVAGMIDDGLKALAANKRDLAVDLFSLCRDSLRNLADRFDEIDERIAKGKENAKD